jgi:hypothetical protein
VRDSHGGGTSPGEQELSHCTHRRGECGFSKDYDINVIYAYWHGRGSIGDGDTDRYDENCGRLVASGGSTTDLRAAMMDAGTKSAVFTIARSRRT